MGELKDWAKKNSKTLTLEDGEVVEVSYEGFKIGASPYDPEKEIVFYRVGVIQEGEKVVKAFKTSSGKAARFFDTCQIGRNVRISRKGTGNATTYEFDTVKSEPNGQPASIQAELADLEGTVQVPAGLTKENLFPNK